MYFLGEGSAVLFCSLVFWFMVVQGINFHPSQAAQESLHGSANDVVTVFLSFYSGVGVVFCQTVQIHTAVGDMCLLVSNAGV